MTSGNITKFIKTLESALKESDVQLYLIRIDNLPILTLAHGHLKTEELLDDVAKKLGAYRLMSDQLCIILPSAGKSDKKALEIKTTLHDMDTHIASCIYQQHVKCGASASVALSTIYSSSMRDGTVFTVPEREASGSNVKESRLQMNLANEIKSAIKEKKFKLAFQPIVEAKTGNISHYEALLRVEDEDGNLKSAGSFIPIAEKMGLIDSIDIYVLEAAIKELKANKNLRLAVNISNLTISNRDWIKKFFDSITPDIGSRLIIEMTETTAFKDLRETAYFVATLQDTGCMFALDDFGSGYTSFRQIRALSFDYIKIDGSLISDIASNPHNRKLVKSLLEYMSGLKIKTIAEFVENGEVAKILMDFGIDYMQGNYFGEAAKLRVG